MPTKQSKQSCASCVKDNNPPQDELLCLSDSELSELYEYVADLRSAAQEIDSVKDELMDAINNYNDAENALKKYLRESLLSGNLDITPNAC